MVGIGMPIKPSEPPIARVLWVIFDRISAAPNVISAKYTPLARIATAPSRNENMPTLTQTVSRTSQNDW